MTARRAHVARDSLTASCQLELVGEGRAAEVVTKIRQRPYECVFIAPIEISCDVTRVLFIDPPRCACTVVRDATNILVYFIFSFLIAR